jgi:hypothetical protein
MKRAVVFFACHDKYYFKAARHSARSVKRQMPDVDTVLLTERTDWRSEAFDRIVSVPKPVPVDVTFPPLSYLPEEYNSGIFVGSQKIFLTPVYDAFELVEDARTDIALTLTSGKPHDAKFPSPGIPKAFPYFRSGFIAFQHYQRVQEFFDLWRAEFNEEKTVYQHLRNQKSHPDQSSLRKALYHSNLSIAVLRINFLATLGDEIIRGTVRTVTFPRGRGPDAVAAEANRLAPYARLFIEGKSRKL